MVRGGQGMRKGGAGMRGGKGMQAGPRLVLTRLVSRPPSHKAGRCGREGEGAREGGGCERGQGHERCDECGGPRWAHSAQGVEGCSTRRQ